MIFDVIVILIFVGLIALNAYRGAARSLAHLIASLIAYVASTALGQWIALGAYDSIVRPAIEKAVTGAVSNAGTKAAENVVTALPSWLTGLLNLSPEDLTDAFSEPINNIKGTISEAVNSAVKPVASGILTFFITLLLFLFFLMILQRFLVRPLVAVFRFPGLNALNHIAGGVIGFIDALLLVCLLAYLIKLVLVNVGSQSTWFNETTINNSFIFCHFYSGNIFTWISSLILR